MAIKCSNCEHARKATLNHQGVGASSYVGEYSQTHYVCQHPERDYSAPGSYYFSGKTKPRYCPIAKK